MNAAEPPKSPISQRAAVLLSTYNGERYLREQIESLLDQDYPHFDIFVRDDGSSDKTTSIIKDYSSKITISLSEENLGPTQSFLELIKGLAPDYAYVFFCDQDDLWFKDKITTSIKELSKDCCNHSKPLVYFTGQKLINSAGEELGHSTHWNSMEGANAFFHNKAPGCSMGFNNIALKLIQEATQSSERRSQVNFHDWWAFMVCSYLGKVIYSPTPLMAYRQHAANQVGLSASPLGFMKKISRLKKIFKHDGYYSVQAKVFYSLYKERIKTEHLSDFKLLEDSKHSFFDRLKLLFSKLSQREGSLAETLALKAIILVNKH